MKTTCHHNDEIYAGSSQPYREEITGCALPIFVPPREFADDT